LRAVQWTTPVSSWAQPGPAPLTRTVPLALAKPRAKVPFTVAVACPTSTAPVPWNVRRALTLIVIASPPVAAPAPPAHCAGRLWNSKRRTALGLPPASLAPNSTPAFGLVPAGPLYCWAAASARPAGMAAVARTATAIGAVRRLISRRYSSAAMRRSSSSRSTAFALSSIARA
jgi:hypothetical protein